MDIIANPDKWAPSSPHSVEAFTIKFLFMLQEKFDPLMKQWFQLIAHRHLAKAISKNLDWVCNPKQLLEDLYAEAFILCSKNIIPEKLESEEKLRGAIANQAKSAFRNYCKDYFKRKNIIYDLFEANFSTYWSADTAKEKAETILNLLRENLSSFEFELFCFRVFDNLSYRELQPYFQKSDAALRQGYHRAHTKAVQLVKQNRL